MVHGWSVLTWVTLLCIHFWLTLHIKIFCWNSERTKRWKKGLQCWQNIIASIPKKGYKGAYTGGTIHAPQVRLGVSNPEWDLYRSGGWMPRTHCGSLGQGLAEVGPFSAQGYNYPRERQCMCHLEYLVGSRCSTSLKTCCSSQIKHRK